MTAQPATAGPPRTHDGVPLAAYSPTDVVYRWDAGRGTFAHPYDRDLQLLVLWSGAREREAELLALVASRMTVVATYEVTWSPQAVSGAFDRLYGLPVGEGSTKPEEVGTGPFLLLVLEDPDPRYGYRSNVSGLVELTSTRVAALKAEARALDGGEYRVHSSNNLQEFFRDATLVLGPDRVDALLAGDVPAGVEPVGDPPGHDGWTDLPELLRTLRRACPYVVLRGFEGLPAVPEDGELDLLARDAADLAAVAGARELYPGPEGSAYRCTVAGRPLDLDTREVGDGYLDARWQDAVLARRTWQGDVPVPRPDDHLFSLLYHATVQKPSVKPAYAALLPRLARTVGMPAEVADRVCEPEVAAGVLDGYLAAHGYGVPRPRDTAVHRNEEFLRLLRRTAPEPSVWSRAAAEAWHAARESAPARRLRGSDRARAVYRRVRGAVRRVVPGRG